MIVVDKIERWSQTNFHQGPNGLPTRFLPFHKQLYHDCLLSGHQVLPCTYLSPDVHMDLVKPSRGTIRLKDPTIFVFPVQSQHSAPLGMCTLYLNPCFSSHAETLQGLFCCCLSSLVVS